MFTTVTVRRVSFGSVYKLLVVGLACGMIPLGLVFGVMAFFGAHTVTWNQEHITGIAGLVAGPLMGAFLAVMFTAFFGSLCIVGLWLFSRVRPMQIAFKPT